MKNGWYKIAQSGEYIGGGEPINGSGNIWQPGKNRLEEADGGATPAAYVNPSGNGKDSPHSSQKKSCIDNKTNRTLVEGGNCPGCYSEMQEHEFHQDSEGSYYFVCENPICSPKTHGYKSRDLGGWNIQVTKKKSRLRHTRSSSISPFVTAASPATPYNNPANRPYGNQEFSEDVRVIPWSVIEPDFQEVWDTHKQKKKLNYKIKKVKDNKGEIKFIKVKDPAAGSGVQPSNSYNQKGDIKKQHRYNPESGVPKGNSSGSWPHNRGVDPSEGWYQSDTVVDKNKFNADMRNRYQTWDEYIRERDNHMLTMTKPY